ncbi:MAG: c-type cytochrome [Candidatus Thiodiazotropha sp.]
MFRVSGSLLFRCLILTLLLCGWCGISHAWENLDPESEAALKLTPNPENGRWVYQGCAVCHMPEGWGTPNGAYPQIAGQHRSVIIKQLADIRANNRDNPSMYPFTLPEELGGIQSIADVAQHIENLKMTLATSKGPGDDLLRGKRLYDEYCVECHGERGEGDAEMVYPRIQGQHYPYLLRQMDWIRNGKRRNANRKMEEAIRMFSDQDLQSVADYVSRMPPDESRRSAGDWSNRDYGRR